MNLLTIPSKEKVMKTAGVVMVTIFAIAQAKKRNQTVRSFFS